MESGHTYQSADREKHSRHCWCSTLFWAGPFSDSSPCISADESGAWEKICNLDFSASRLFGLSLFITFLHHYSTSCGGFGKSCTNRPRENDRERQHARIISHLHIQLPLFVLFVWGHVIPHMGHFSKTWNPCQRRENGPPVRCLTEFWDGRFAASLIV